MNLRLFEFDDFHEVQALLIRTFTDAEGNQAGQLLGKLVHDLVLCTDERDLVGFVAEGRDCITGSVFFSRVDLVTSCEDRTSLPSSPFLLSPMAVSSAEQGKGIGQKLIRFALDHLHMSGVDCVFTYGDPDYYRRFGFHWIDPKTIIPPSKLSQPKGWLVKSDEQVLGFSSGVKMICVDAFRDEVYW